MSTKIEYLDKAKVLDYDSDGRLIHVVLIDDVECWFKYNSYGALIHYKDSEGNEHRWNPIGVDTPKKVKYRKIFRKVKKNDRKCKN